jgi:hypothetical protein
MSAEGIIMIITILPLRPHQPPLHPGRMDTPLVSVRRRVFTLMSSMSTSVAFRFWLTSDAAMIMWIAYLYTRTRKPRQPTSSGSRAITKDSEVVAVRWEHPAVYGPILER